LPRWIELGAFTLALLAGTVNAVDLLGFAHQYISHLSGTATQLGAELAAAALICFVLALGYHLYIIRRAG
jgi:uncharacterized membrane protein YoaK (UPF0700 family)